jgi:hypothetical protein
MYKALVTVSHLPFLPCNNCLILCHISQESASHETQKPDLKTCLVDIWEKNFWLSCDPDYMYAHARTHTHTHTQAQTPTVLGAYIISKLLVELLLQHSL